MEESSIKKKGCNAGFEEPKCAVGRLAFDDKGFPLQKEVRNLSS